MGDYFIDGLAAMAHPGIHFYNCDRCSWSGNKLAYANGDGRGRYLRGHSFNQKPNRRLYKPWQGHCPQCGCPFAGTRSEAEGVEIICVPEGESITLGSRAVLKDVVIVGVEAEDDPETMP